MKAHKKEKNCITIAIINIKYLGTAVILIINLALLCFCFVCPCKQNLMLS